ncbi:pilus assembly protein PilM [Alicyclobacillus cycloheptanicus]|uniref:Tfp pilus assembly PilM family ATPase n=1 Tax=Alicyclobacillus cycloheptanicus TaxID=1457 RepID=A0ABT9XDD4_9BACL|nr:pilus assembly protein PilM [Alicyclobacillus cycloheptanicus]MDQ0188309.1 Tfp pilus assembly PilM family ATPase [Alicyclobacillus cycloheptanicus]WDM01023.1 pilus assembly protein PilM [Alicyclobacillus cycloheptanicus]
MGNSVQVGIEFGRRAVRCAVLKRAGFAALGSAFELGPMTWDDADPVIADEYRAALRAIVKTEHLKGAHAVLGLPIGATVVRPHRLPPLAANLIGDAVRAEMESQMIVPFSDPAFDYAVFPGGDGPDATYVTIYAARREQVRALQAVVRSVGMRPIAVEPRSLALLRLLLHRRTDSLNGTALVVDVSQGALELTVVYRQVIVASRSVMFEQAQSSEEVAPILAQEVSRYLNFLQYGAIYGSPLQCDVVWLCTEEAHGDAWARALETVSHLPVWAVDLQAETERLISASRASLYAAAGGLALRKGRARWRRR